MQTKKRLFILNKLPTPYNDYLFRTLHNDPDLDLQVFHLWRVSTRRPWQSVLGTEYPNYYMHLKWGVDWHTLRAAWHEQNALFMIGDWAHIPTIALVLVRVFRRLPVVLWVDTPQEQLKRPFWKRIPRSMFLRCLLSSVDLVFGTGQPARRILLSMGVSPRKIADLQFSVDIEHPIKAAENNALPEQVKKLREAVYCGDHGVVFGISGTIDLEKKAQDVGLQAFAQCVKQSNKPLGLLLAGDGADMSYLQNLVEKCGIAERVCFLGWQEPCEMDVFYSAIDVLLHPANYDPFPVVILEAMSWSKPVIGTITCGSIEERVEDGINGFIVQPGSVSEMRDAMLRFIHNPSLVKLAGQAARRTAELWPVSRSVSAIKRQIAKLVT